MTPSSTETEVDLQSWWRESCPLFEHIGLVVDTARDGCYRCKVPLTAGNSNHFRSMHAAVQMAVVEVLGGIVGMAIIPSDMRSGVFGAVRSLHIDFLRPARSALLAETQFGHAAADAVCQALGRGENTEFRLNTVVRDEAGETIATAQADYVLRPRRSTTSTDPA